MDHIFILSVTQSREHRLRAFGNRVLERRFGPKRDEETGKWRRMSEEEVRVIYIYIYTQYCADDKIEKNEMGWACGAYG